MSPVEVSRVSVFIYLSVFPALLSGVKFMCLSLDFSVYFLFYFDTSLPCVHYVQFCFFCLVTPDLSLLCSQLCPLHSPVYLLSQSSRVHCVFCGHVLEPSLWVNGFESHLSYFVVSLSSVINIFTFMLVCLGLTLPATLRNLTPFFLSQ